MSFITKYKIPLIIIGLMLVVAIALIPLLNLTPSANEIACPPTANQTTAPTVTPPTVVITAPPAGGTYSGSLDIVTQVTAPYGVSRVRLQIDGVYSGAALTSAPYNFNIDTSKLANGYHTFTIEVSDTYGNIRAASVSVMTSNPTPSNSSTPTATPTSSSSTRPSATPTSQTTKSPTPKSTFNWRALFGLQSTHAQTICGSSSSSTTPKVASTTPTATPTPQVTPATTPSAATSTAKPTPCPSPTTVIDPGIDGRKDIDPGLPARITGLIGYISAAGKTIATSQESPPGNSEYFVVIVYENVPNHPGQTLAAGNSNLSGKGPFSTIFVQFPNSQPTVMYDDSALRKASSTIEIAFYKDKCGTIHLRITGGSDYVAPIDELPPAIVSQVPSNPSTDSQSKISPNGAVDNQSNSRAVTSTTPNTQVSSCRKGFWGGIINVWRLITGRRCTPVANNNTQNTSTNSSNVGISSKNKNTPHKNQLKLTIFNPKGSETFISGEGYKVEYSITLADGSPIPDSVSDVWVSMNLFPNDEHVYTDNQGKDYTATPCVSHAKGQHLQCTVNATLKNGVDKLNLNVTGWAYIGDVKVKKVLIPNVVPPLPDTTAFSPGTLTVTNH